MNVLNIVPILPSLQTSQPCKVKYGKMDIQNTTTNCTVVLCIINIKLKTFSMCGSFSSISSSSVASVKVSVIVVASQLFCFP